MSLSQLDIRILSAPEEVMPFVKSVQSAADTHKDSLGFLPEGVYKEAAEQGKLLVAGAVAGGTSEYAGHLLHGGAFPHARIFQVFTVPAFRRRGVGRRLIDSIVKTCESRQFMSVIARVADDLEANQFWERLSFGLVRAVRGGRARARTINVRIRELDTPSLLVPSTRGRSADLGLISQLTNPSPTYILDLNIIYDLLKKRANSEHVGRILAASFNNLVRLAVTDELVEELKRTSVPDPTDPVLEFALQLPRVLVPAAKSLELIVGDLSPTIFPERYAAQKLTAQDKSDLRHLAAAIHHKAAGFVTGEKAILRARMQLQNKYSIDVIGAGEFANAVQPAAGSNTDIEARSEGRPLHAKQFQTDDVSAVNAFLGRMHCPLQLVDHSICDQSAHANRRLIVSSGENVVGFARWDASSAIRPRIAAFACLDEDHRDFSTAADFLLDRISRESDGQYPVQIGLRLLYGHAATRQIALMHGFRPPVDDPFDRTSLHKIALGRFVTSENWPSLMRQLKQRMNLELPAVMPRLKAGEKIAARSPAGGDLELSVEELENLLSPALFFFSGRDGAIVPIRKVYALELLGGGRQMSFTASAEAQLLRERVYISGHRTSRTLTIGSPIFFYESASREGGGCAIAAARVIGTELILRHGLSSETLRRAVLNETILKKIFLSETVLATRIDNIIMLKNPVSLSTLRCIGAVDAANLVTARRLTADQMVRIVEESEAQ